MVGHQHAKSRWALYHIWPIERHLREHFTMFCQQGGLPRKCFIMFFSTLKNMMTTEYATGQNDVISLRKKAIHLSYDVRKIVA